CARMGYYGYFDVW
nr:immunoglobulin heavy chain junction region [Mus musculus]